MTKMPEYSLKKDVLQGGEFLIKDEQVRNVFIPEELNEEQQMIRQMVRDFAEEAKLDSPHMDKQVELLQKAGELGLLSSHIAEEFGGMPLDTNTNTVINEEMGHIPGGFTTTYAAHVGIGTLPIVYFGTDAQKAKYLPGLATGELKASYCLTEPSSGSDALAAKTTAVLTDDGKHYIINGQKMWITNAGFADVFIVFAKIDGEKFTGFIIERDTAGFTFGAEEAKLGIKGSSTRQVFFENVKIPVDNLLGEAGKGHLIAFNILNVGRFKLGVLTMGGSKSAIKGATQYANERVQFKVPISSFGAIQYKLAEMAIRTFATESTCYRVSDLMQDKEHNLLSQGKSRTEALLESAEEYAIECAILKVLGSETADYCVDELVQVHGGYGFSEEYPAAMAYRDSRIGRIYEGTNEINRMLSVNMLLKRAMKGKLDIVGPAWEVQKELASMPAFGSPEGVYGEEYKAVKNFKKLVLMVAGAAAKMQMEGQLDLRNEQEILMNVADMMIVTYNAESLLLRVDKLQNTASKPQTQDVYDAILKTYIYDAAAQMEKFSKDALVSFTEGDLLKTMLMGLKRFVKYPPTNVKENRRLIASKLIEANGYCL
ncbi:MAG: alkylation response protein AidB-like acyl-CoA dehydrogenase [Saprospiraceae bacterium]|jgi:alkylation response protein AidB-like acyl-CoA dehydrogenase